MSRIDKIAIIGVPQDLGASRRGVDMGPSALRVARLAENLSSLGYQVTDFGNINCQDIEDHELIKHNQNPRLRYHYQILETCKKLKKQVTNVISQNYFPLIIGGDHSITIGTMGGLKSLHNGKTGILWIDAHGDFNTTDTTPSGNIHGMPFSIITGRGDKELQNVSESPSIIETNAVLIGARDLDIGEIDELKSSKVTVFTMKDIDERGIAKIAKEAILIATNNVDHLHVSFDIDALDPKEAPGTGTRVSGGLTYREAHLIMEYVHECGKLSSFEMVEVNPSLDERNRTAKLGVELIASVLGKKII